VNSLTGLAGDIGLRASKALFLQALSSTRRGRLTLTLPDGKKRAFGGQLAGPSVEAWIQHEAFFGRIILTGEIGLGETYVDGLWDTNDLTNLLILGIENRQYAPKLVRKVNDLTRIPNRWQQVTRHNDLTNSQPIQNHYDLSNELFTLFLDETLTYSSAVFEHEDQSLADAQRHKYDVIARKAGIRAADTVLEIGCGWGGFALHVAQNYSCQVVATTLSRRQYELAARRIVEAGLGDAIDLRLADYNEITGAFDKVVSIEMLQAVGADYFAGYLEKVNSVLRPGGRMVMQTISVPERTFASLRDRISWMQKYIFLGAMPASLAAIDRALTGTRLVLSDVEDIGAHYVRTLREWRQRFEDRQAEIRGLGFDERFIRMWRYYLCSAEAGFATRSTSDLQIVLDKV
jgi:cyclopropane-fatty-acyl-phospholipid synthase